MKNPLRDAGILFFNPFLPKRKFIAPKLIILTKCLIDILFFDVLF